MKHFQIACFFAGFLAASVAVHSQVPVSLLDDVPLSAAEPVFAPIGSAQAPTARWASTDAPLPTNAWWENFVLNI